MSRNRLSLNMLVGISSFVISGPILIEIYSKSLDEIRQKFSNFYNDLLFKSRSIFEVGTVTVKEKT